MLEDGTYDVIVVDAEEADAETAGSALAARVDVAVLAGAHKGEVLTLTARGLGRDPMDLLAVPGTLVVAGGVPDLRLEP